MLDARAGPAANPRLHRGAHTARLELTVEYGDAAGPATLCGSLTVASPPIGTRSQRDRALPATRTRRVRCDWRSRGPGAAPSGSAREKRLARGSRPSPRWCSSSTRSPPGTPSSWRRRARGRPSPACSSWSSGQAKDLAAPLIAKPFDAAELAAVLSRELEDRDAGSHSRSGFQAQADELALLVEATFEAIIGVTANGVVRSWNRGAAAILRLPRLGDDRPPPRPARRARCVQVAPRDARASDDRGAALQDGARSSLSSLFLAMGAPESPFGFAEVSLDVTERRRLEREFEHIGQRLAAVGAPRGRDGARD